ncbi:sigma 54-interacting transcriptional regulator [Leptolyngbya sp. 7M]|uniref:sigma 54-interacting transcriptional regulator n=1 Tax=Leptolyngbya sp. 7M TaxID=2812896 RepID=UPI001CEDBDB6
MMILRGELDQAKELLEQAVAIAKEKKREWYEAQAMRNLARCMLAEGRFEDAKTIARATIELSGRIGDKHYAKMSRIVLADALLATNSLDECVEVLDSLGSEEAESEDFFVFGSIQRIRGLRAIRSGDLETGIHHLNRCLTIFETASDTYNTAIAHFLLGQHLPSENADRALKHIRSAKEIFQKLGLQKLLAETEEYVSRRAAAKAKFVDSGRNLAVSQMISARLAEATASRELLLRELAAVLEQESRIERLLIVEVQGSNLVPFIAKGFARDEADKFLSTFFESEKTGDEKKLARGRDLELFRLSPQAARPLLLFAGPIKNVVLIDGGPIAPLLRVVELGLDVIALREDGRTKPLETFSASSSANGMLPGFIHSSPAMTSLVEEIYKIRSSDVTVLVTGESGTGKELVSRAIHSLSNRKDKVFVPFNCTAVPKELAEGHLFGYRKGAFTGAVTDSPGMIRAADGGTLFLDEVGDLPLDVQPKLLRFLQEGEVQPVGEKRPIKVDVRVIAATNMPLEEKVADGSFREDLYYRLNVIRLRVPPLRERRSEIPPMVNYYVKHYSDKFGKRDITITPQTIDLLMVCDWEGNVRQLCNELQRVIARASDGDTITPEHLSPELKRSTRPIAPYSSGLVNIAQDRTQHAIRPFVNLPKGGTLEDAVTELEMQMIRDSLSRHNWNISRVANELGLTRRGLYLKLARYGIDKAT